jgi:hypothetical protein
MPQRLTVGQLDAMAVSQLLPRAYKPRAPTSAELIHGQISRSACKSARAMFSSPFGQPGAREFKKTRWRG